MYCTNCGKEIGDGSRFCTACGAQQQPQQAPPQQMQPQPQQAPYQQQPYPQTQAQPQQTAYRQPYPQMQMQQAAYQQPYPYSAVPAPVQEKKGKGGLIALLVSLAVVFLGLIGFGAYKVMTSLPQKQETAALTLEERIGSDGEEAEEEPEKDEPDDSDNTVTPDPEEPDDDPQEEKSQEELLSGTWKLEYDMGSLLAEELGSELGEVADFVNPLKMTLYFIFDGNGNFVMFVDEDSLKESYENWLGELITFMIDMLYREFEAAGMSREQADALMMSSQGHTLEDYVKEYLLSSMEMEDIFSGMQTAGTYEVEDGKLYMAQYGEEYDRENYNYFYVEGDTLRIDMPDGSKPEEFIEGLKFPLYLERVQ